MSLRVVVPDPTSQDVLNIATYIARGSLDAAVRFLETARATFEMLAEWPGIGSQVEHRGKPVGGLRRWPIHGFLNYLVFYRADTETITIVAVIHGARKYLKILRKRL